MFQILYPIFAMASKLFYSFPCILLLFFFLLPVFSQLHRPHLHQKTSLDKNTYRSPFGFLKKMQGCHKGEKVKGLGGVKLYLSRFGYLNYQNDDNATNPEEDYFDEELEVAIKSYQGYYRLNATGVLDAPTVFMMIMPRCGFPDKQTHQHSGDNNNNNNNNNTSSRFASHYRLFPARSRWPYGKTHLTYGFGSRFPTRFMPSIRRALTRWATTSQYFTFSRATTPQTADIKISFARGSHRDGAPFDGRGGVMAHAFAPMDGRLHFDVDDRWSAGTDPYAYDIETVALHELGHVLGLGHSQYRNSIMWATIGFGESRGLTLDDIRGLRALYGSY